MKKFGARGGLAYNGEHWIIGGFTFASRNERSKTNGVLWVLSKDWEVLEEVVSPQIGQVNEIRFLNSDRCLSDYK